MSTTAAPRPMTPEEKKVIFASSLGTVFEWYDFYLYGSLAAIIAKQFFSGLDAGSAFIFALLATLIVVLAGVFATPSTVGQVVDAWGRGFWDLIPFTLQMALVIITGHVLATSPPSPSDRNAKCLSVARRATAWASAPCKTSSTVCRTRALRFRSGSSCASSSTPRARSSPSRPRSCRCPTTCRACSRS